MDKEPIIAQEVIHLAFDDLLELSLQQWKKSLGPLPTKGDATPQGDNASPRQSVVDSSKAIEDVKEGQ